MRYLRALIVGLVLAAASSIAVEAATRTWTVTPDPAAPGDAVTDAIHDYGGGGAAFRGTDLYLVSDGAVRDGLLCSEMPGAIRVAAIEWADNGLHHEGRAHFTLPVVPDGPYWLAEQVPGVIPPCHPAGSITVSASRSPDTAMPRNESRGIFLPLGGLMVLVAIMGGAAREAKLSARRADCECQ